MAAWQLNESRGLGRSDRIWKLSKDGEGLSVGRAKDNDIHILSQSVEKKHSVIKWDHKKECYVIHDLGSVNGTFINGLPLRSGTVPLKAGDSLRFGYDKGHLFRVKRVEPPTSVPSAPPPHSSSSPPPPQSPISTSFTLTPPPDHHFQTPPQVQYVPIASMMSSTAPPPVVLPTLQPYIVPQLSMYGPYVPQLNMPQLSHMTGHVTPSLHSMSLYGSDVPSSPLPPTPQPSQQYPLHPTPATPTIPLATPTTPMTTPITQLASSPTSISTPPVKPAVSTECSTNPPRSHSAWPSTVHPRKDGRRSISLSSGDTPTLSHTTSLYGWPDWCGDEEEDPAITKARRDRSNEIQISRDVSTHQFRASLVSNSTQHSHRLSKSATRTAVSKDETRTEMAVSNDQKDVCGSPNFTWTIQTGPQQSRALPPKWRRHVRSVESTPTGRPGRERRSASLSSTPVRRSKNAAGSNRDFTPLSQRVTASKPPSGSQRSGRRSSPSPVMRTGAESSPSGPTDHTKQKKQSSDVRRSNTMSHFTSHSTQTPTTNVPSDPNNLSSSRSLYFPRRLSPTRSQSETDIVGSCKENADKTFVVMSPSDDERPSSARRRQWNHESEQSPQNSLMMASIEARMRRLNRLAQSTYHTLSNTVRHGRMSQPHTVTTASSPIDPVLSDTQLPEWKFFNTEVDSIFRNIRSVEKWLKDIDVAVVGLQLTDGEREKAHSGEGEREKESEREEEPEGKGQGERGRGREGEEADGKRGREGDWKDKQEEKRGADGEQEGFELVDFPDDTFGSSESGGAQFQDSIEDLTGSSD